MRSHLRKTCSSKNQFRFYSMVITPDLFGGVTLCRRWGRIGKPGQELIQHYLEMGEAQDVLSRIIKSKLRRGYSILI